MELEATPREGPSAVVLVDALPLRRAELSAFLAAWADDLGLYVRALGIPVEFSELPAARIAVVNLGAESFEDGETEALIVSLRKALKSCPIAVLADWAEPDDIVAAFRLGVRGYIPNGTEPQVALRALTFIINGGSYFPPTALLQPASAERGEGFGADGRPGIGSPKKNGKDVHEDDPHDLTARQREVLDLLCRGAPNREISRTLAMKEATVKVHVRQIIRKLGVANRTQAAMIRIGQVRER